MHNADNDDNTADKVKIKYAYMDKMPLEGWAWEFIRRNASYKTLYDEIKRDFNSMKSLKGITDFNSVLNKIEKHPVNDKLSRMRNEFHIRVGVDSFNIRTGFYQKTPKEVDNFLAAEELSIFIAVPNPDKAYNEFRYRKPSILGATSVKSLALDFDMQHLFQGDIDKVQKEPTMELYQYCHKTLLKDLPPVDASDTLYFGVSLHGKLHDIMQQIHDVLDNYFDYSKTRNIDKKWKYYLIVYDLMKNHDKSSDDCGQILQLAFKKVDVKPRTDDGQAKGGKIRKALDPFMENKNIDNYYKNAVVLINDNFGKYLNLAK